MAQCRKQIIQQHKSKTYKIKNLTTTIIALFTIATSVFANNTNPNTASVIVASVNNSNVAISFTSANNSKFEIERSFYSNNFTVIASVNAVFAGNFKINDNAAELAGRKIAYYRVKTIAANGTVSYSNTTVINLEATEGAIVTKGTINFTATQNGNAVIKVKSITGQTAATVNSIDAKGNNTIAINNNLVKGIYIVEVAVNGVVTDTQKIIAE